MLTINTSKKGKGQKVWGHLGGSVSSALDFGSGHDLIIFKPHIRLCTDSVEPAWYSTSLSLSLSLSATPLLMLPFSK